MPVTQIATRILRECNRKSIIRRGLGRFVAMLHPQVEYATVLRLGLGVVPLRHSIDHQLQHHFGHLVKCILATRGQNWLPNVHQPNCSVSIKIARASVCVYAFASQYHSRLLGGVASHEVKKCLSWKCSALHRIDPGYEYASAFSDSLKSNGTCWSFQSYAVYLGLKT